MVARNAIVSAIISDIKNSKYRVGDTISQRKIEADYGGGRWVAMRALEELEASNWLEHSERGRYVVAEITRATFEQAIEMRVLLETYAAGKLIKIVTDPFVWRLWEINRDMLSCAQEGDFQAAVSANRLFHETFVGSVDSGPLSRQLHQLYQIQGFDDASNFTSIEQVRRSAYEHGRIIAALRSGNLEALKREITAHVTENSEAIFAIS